RRCLGIFRKSGNRFSERKCTSIESGALFGNSSSSPSTQTKSALIGGEIEDAAPFEKILPLPGNFRPGASAPPRGWTMSEWRAEITRKSRARLNGALRAIFPTPVIPHALARSFIPAMPRRAVDSYWRAHPVRADRLARALAAASGGPAGWTWRLEGE